MTDHPLAQYEEVLRRFSSHATDQIGALGANQEVVMGGMLTQVRYMNTKKARNGNSRYLRCKLEDFAGSVECVMWPDDFARYKEQPLEDRVCFVKGAVERTREQPGLILTKLYTVEEVQREFTKAVSISLDLRDHNPLTVDTLARLFRDARGGCPVNIWVRDGAGKLAQLRVSGENGVDPNKLSVGELEAVLGPGRVKFSGLMNGNRN
jgi:DNA polymerase-3 subunit alpha